MTHKSLRWGSVARVVRLDRPRWLDSQELQAGDRIGSEWIKLKSGSVKLMLPPANVLTLHGPSKLRLVHRSRVGLLEGEIDVQVPACLHRFVISTPSVDVATCGSHFAVDIRGDSETRIQVFNGEVLAQGSSSDNSAILATGQRALFTNALSNGGHRFQ